jgi:GH15 family glucan-1,4-alpha-glucosidase
MKERSMEGMSDGRGDGSDPIRASVESILAHQDPNGALVASRDFVTYNYCWLRDGSFIAFALDRAGEHEAAARFHRWVVGAIAGIADVIDDVIRRSDLGEELPLEHMPPARFALDGSVVADDWPNFQIDGYGTWLWALEQHLIATDRESVPAEFREAAVRVARYVDALALTHCFDVWEEHGDARHVSTLACVYGGLRAAARMLGMDELIGRADGVQLAAREGTARLGRFVKSTASDAVDASLLWLATPFALVEVGDPHFIETVRVIEDQLTFEGGLRRYPTDTYYGSGSWPVLTASLGWHYVAAGNHVAARRCQAWIFDQIDAQGRLAEQYGGERRDRAHYDEWVKRWGPPAADLTWSHAMHVVLATEMEAQAAVTSGETG